MNILPWFVRTHTQLTEAARSQRLPHVIIINTFPASGVDSFLEELAKGILCTNKQNLAYCDNCAACSSVTKKDNQYYHPLDDQAVVKIDMVREVLSLDSLGFIGTKHVIAIPDLGKVTMQAIDALLKTTEEAKDDIYFVFGMSKGSRVKKTILSRAAVYQITSHDMQSLLPWLTTQHADYIAKNNVTPKNLALLVELSNNMPYLAEEYLLQDYLARREQLLTAFKNCLEEPLLKKTVPFLSKFLVAFPVDDMRMMSFSLGWLSDYFTKRLMQTIQQPAKNYFSPELLHQAILLIDERLAFFKRFDNMKINISLSLLDLLINLTQLLE